MGKFSQFDNYKTYWDATAYTRGSYQLAILDGTEAISGSTLRGRARKWSSKYKDSAWTLLRRLRNAGFTVEIVKGKFNRHVVSVSRPTDTDRISRSASCDLRLRPNGVPTYVRCVRPTHTGWSSGFADPATLVQMRRRSTSQRGVTPLFRGSAAKSLMPIAYLRAVRGTNGKA